VKKNSTAAKLGQIHTTQYCSQPQIVIFLLSVINANVPFAHDEGDCRDESDDPHKGGKVAGRRGLVHHAHLLAQLGAVVPPLRGDAAKNDHGKYLKGRIEVGGAEQTTFRTFQVWWVQQ
jgi:hypothetical protein